MADSIYTTTVPHVDAPLTAEEKKLMDGYMLQWEAANAAGNALSMAEAHAAAELIRAKSVNLPSVTAAKSSNGKQTVSYGYRAAALPKAQSMESYINAIYAAQENLALEQLRAQYEQNVLELDRASAKIPEEYAAARNSVSSNSEIAKAAFNERAAAHGLSSGTGAQATLSMNNALLGNLSSISSAEADAMSGVALSRNQLQAAYSSNISKAIAENNLEKASALYKELVRLDEAEYSRALAQANENYRAYQTAKA